MKLFSLIVSFILVVGCNSKAEDTAVKVSGKEDSERITPKEIANLKFTDYALSPESKEAVINWQRYQELMTQTEFLKQADFSFFGGKNELLLNFLKDLKKDIPANVNTPAISDRLIALETKILKFHSTLMLSNADKKQTLKDLKELLVATSNLHLQINKKFELESQVIEDPSADGAPTY